MCFLLSKSCENVYSDIVLIIISGGKMKKLSFVALLSVLAMPAFASVAPSSETAASDIVAQQLSESEKLKLRQEFKDEIKAELKQEYIDAKKSAESEHGFLHGVQLGVGVSGLTGLNGFVGYVNKDFDSFWAKRLGIRFDVGMTRPVKSLMSDAIDAVAGDDGFDVGAGLMLTDADFEAHHYAVMVDFYPFGDTWLLGGWRLSGGYYVGNMEMDANIAGSVDGASGFHKFELDGNQYAYAGGAIDGTAQLDWKYRGPYLGTGFDFGLTSGFKTYVDAGLVFTNRAAVLSLDVPTDNLRQWGGSDWVDVDTAELETAIKNTLHKAQSDLNDSKFYPMVKMGIMYRF